MSDSALHTRTAPAAEALQRLSSALRSPRAPRESAAELVAYVRRITEARCAALVWTRSLMASAARTDVIFDPPEHRAAADSQSLRLLTAEALRVPANVQWDERSPADIQLLLQGAGFTRCIALPLDSGTRRRGVLLLLDAPIGQLEASAWLLEPFASVLALTTPWPAEVPSELDLRGGTDGSGETDQLRRIERALSTAVGEVQDVNEGLSLCLDAAIQVGGLDSGGIYLVDEITGALDCIEHRGLSPDFVRSVAHFGPDTLQAKVALAGDPMYVEFGNAARTYPPAERKEGLRLLAIVPLRHAGRVIGCLNVASHTVDEISLSRRHALESVAAEAAHAIARLRAGVALRQSEARAHALLNAVPDLLFRITRDGVFLDYRADTQDLYVQDPSAIIGRNFHDLLPPHAVHIIDERLKEIANTGGLATFEYHLHMPDAGLCYYEARMAPSGDNEVTVVVRNITERTRAQQQLRDNEARFRHLIESANDWIWESDKSGILSYCSPHCEAITGYAPAELVGRPIFDLITERDLFRSREFGRQQAAQPTSFRGFVWSITGKNGAVVVLESNGVPVFSESGELLGFRGVHRDISARRREEDETKRLQNELAQAQKMESVGRLAGGVAHDFNNMLQAILGNAALAMRGLAADNPLRDRLSEIQNCAERSADLTRQLLAFARKQTASPKVLDLNRSVEGMLKMLRRLIGEDIQLAWLPGDGISQVRIDPSQVDQILANLCVNARDALSGAGLITISTSSATFDSASRADIPEALPGEYVRLSVSDNGAGMSPSVLERALEPFFTTKELGRGTGLGLSTVYGIVRQNGGFLQLLSEQSVGTRVEIYLPAISDAAHIAEHALDAALDVARGHETVLLVEDEPAILAVARSMLQSLGYTVLTASTPGHAIEIAVQHPGAIHVLVTDVVMPEMNGLELSKRLRAIRPTLKRLYTSGYTSDVIAQRGLVEKGVHFIQKPFDLSAIARKVREALDDVGEDVVLT